jgi:hypothetical protein
LPCLLPLPKINTIVPYPLWLISYNIGKIIAMKKILIAISLLVGFAACEHQSQLDPQPTTIAEQEPVATDDATGKLITKTVQRDFPVRSTSTIAGGPAHLSEGTERSSANVNATPPIWFEPNAGAIWKDPATGLTHLMALQLPGRKEPTEEELLKASLGTGWEGSEFITMDRENFYVVWGDAVYKNPKRTPGEWTLIVPYNGEDIKGIAAIQSNNSSGAGFYLVRGNCMTTVNKFGNFSSLVMGCSNAINSTKRMAYFRSTTLPDPIGGFNFLFREFSDKTWYFSNPDGFFQWTHLFELPKNAMREMVGNPMSNKFYMSYESFGVMRIDEIDPRGNGFPSLFGGFNYSPSTASLVVNNGYVWIMGNTLRRVVTFGEFKGTLSIDFGGWNGIQIACADPTLVFN